MIASFRKRVVLLLLLIVLVGGAVQLVAVRAAPAEDADPAALRPTVLSSSKNSPSLPLRQLALERDADGPTVKEAAEEADAIPFFALPKARASGVSGPAPELPDQPASVDAMPLPIHNFEGLDNINGVLPPDTEGDVGYDPNTGIKYYLQWVNLSLAVWDVTDANNVTLELGPIDGSVLWTGFGGPCENTNDGDPIVLFDQMENRWMASQFALPNFPSAPYYQCIAVSQTADPTGAWHLYEYQWPVPKMNDYPKFGVWPDGYYITVNQFANDATSWGGAGVGAFDKFAMMSGNPADFVFFDLFSVNSGFGGMLPADMDGNPPPPGTPAFFAQWDDSSWLGDPADTIRIWEFDVDWNNPAASTFGLSGLPNDSVTTMDVDPDLCSFSRSCIPQPGGTPLDAISDRIMFRLAYRRVGNTDVLLSNHSVDVDGSDHAGIHWFELHGDAGTWSLYQDGVVAPDADHRWMGSIAMDHSGNIALGYSVSSATTFPSIRYTGRLSGDPLGTMPQGEAELIAGSGYQEHSASRWGDYSMLAIDPTDDCTFWFTSEYYATIGSAPWQTRIGSFRFPNCTTGPVGTLTGQVVDGGAGVDGARVEATLGLTQTFAATTNQNGYYTVTLPAGTYDATAWKYGYQPQSVSGLTIISGTITTQDFSLVVADSYTVNGTVVDANTGWPLYAVIEIGGYPGDAVWTDPETGAYSLSLAAGITYTFDVAAWVGGYLPESRQVGPLTGDITEDFALQIDGEACIAPGYSYDYAYFEDFEGGNGGFVVSGTTTWEYGMPTSGPGAAYSGDYLWATNLAGAYDNNEVGAITSPNIDLSAYAGQETALTWWQYYDGENCCDFISVEVSNDGGTSWAGVYGPFDGADVQEQVWVQEQVLLDPSYSVANFQVRFNFDSDFSVTYPGWYVDDVGLIEVASPPPAPPLLEEDFEGAFPPAGWSTTDLAGTGNTWERSDILGVTNQTPGSGFSAAAEPSAAEAWDTQLIGPPVDLSGLTQPELTYNSNFQDFAGNGDIWLDITADGGTTWTNLRYQTADDPTGGTQELVDLGAYANQTVQLRFWYSATATTAWYWHVDDVVVRQASPSVLSCSPLAGGLAVGNVYDENTGMPIDEATVYNDGGFQTMTWPTPDDPAVDDGFYTLFSMDGTHAFTATLENSDYGMDTASVAVPLYDAVTQDFSLPAGWLDANPAGLAAVMELGDVNNLDFDLQNMGNLDAYWEIQELSEGRAILGPIEPMPDAVVKPFKQGYPDTRRLNLPPAPEAPPYAAGGVLQQWFAAEAGAAPWGIAYDGADSTVWISEGWGNNMLWEYEPDGTYTGRSYDYPWAPAFGPGDLAHNWNTGMLWVLDIGTDNCIHEIDPASGVTGNVICPDGSGFATSQRGLAYDPATDTFLAGGWNDSMVYRFATDGTILQQVNVGLAISGLAYNPETMHLFAMVNADPNLVYVLDAADNYNLIGQFAVGAGFAGFSGAGLEFDCDGNLWAVDQDTDTVYLFESGELATLCARDVPWVIPAPVTGTVATNSSQNVQVTFDASVGMVDQPGDYYAALKIVNDTPYGSLYVPLTMTVNVPPGWGKVDGTITGLGRCDASPAVPLSGAMLRIEGTNGMTATVEADASGYYEWWMHAADTSPITVTASYPGWVANTVDGVILTASATTTADVELRLDAPCASRTPNSLGMTVVEGTSERETFSVVNDGAGTLFYNVLETLRDLPYAPQPLAETPRYSDPAPAGPTSIRATAGVTAAPEPTLPDSTWYAGLDLPGGIVRYGHAQCDEQPNSFYVISGVDGTGTISDMAWRYDSHTNTWVELAPIPQASEGPTAVCYWGNIYVMGGDGTDMFYIYNVATDQWMAGPPLLRGVAGGAAGAWNGMVYLAGGDADFTPSTGVSDAIDVFDISSGTWMTTAMTLAAGTSFPGYVQAENYLYVVGGWGVQAPTSTITLTQRLDMALGSLQVGPLFDDARADFALAATNAALYAIGGDADGGGFFDADDLVQRLDLSTWPGGTWANLGDPLPVARSANNAGFCTSALFSAELWSVGGANGAIFGDNRFMATSESCASVYEDVPWLLEMPAPASVAPDSTMPVEVTFDAIGVAPGTYNAALLITTNDFGEPRLQLPVSMTVIAAVHAVDLSPGTSAQTAVPGSMVTYTLQLHNGSNMTATFDLTIGSHAWFMAMSETTVTLGAGESRDVTVMVHVPTDAADGDWEAVEITATMVGDSATLATATLTTTAALSADFGVLVSPPTSAELGVIGEAVSYTLSVRNTGNVTDTFDLSVSGNTWPVSLSQSEVTLAAGAQMDVMATVAVPAGTAVGAFDTATVTATSQGDPGTAGSASLFTSAVRVERFVLLPIIVK